MKVYLKTHNFCRHSKNFEIVIYMLFLQFYMHFYISYSIFISHFYLQSFHMQFRQIDFHLKKSKYIIF